MIAIVVAAGSSKRMGFDKLMADLAGKPVLAHSLLALERTPRVQKIVLVGREDRLEEFRALGVKYGITKLNDVIPGGSERHLSVWSGIQAGKPSPSDYIAVHDAARPLVTPEAVEACYQLASRHGASACAAPIADTLKRVSADGAVVGSVDRTNLWAMQTPQIFLASVLLHAYQQILREGEIVTDEVSAVERLGLAVVLARNDEPNFKITVPRDLDVAKLVLGSRVGGQ